KQQADQQHIDQPGEDAAEHDAFGQHVVVHRYMVDHGVSRIFAVTASACGPSVIVAPSRQRVRKSRAWRLSRLPDWPGATMNSERSRSARSYTPRYSAPCTDW